MQKKNPRTRSPTRSFTRSTGKQVTEAAFQTKLLKRLRKIPRSWFAVKEAKSLRGLPDIYGCINGHFVTLESKKSEAEARKSTGHICLQRKNLADVRAIGGYASFVYPENLEQVIAELTALSC